VLTPGVVVDAVGLTEDYPVRSEIGPVSRAVRDSRSEANVRAFASATVTQSYEGPASRSPIV
jgi:hypothetical protein